MKIDEAIYPQIQSNLLDWYRSIKRDLPWRRTRNPYYIWISEVMLQQTQVDTVIPYYERFTSRFPTMRDLAYASEEEVLKLWEGLGYYSRARNLQSGVREVVETYGGEIPTDRSAILKIKGIGPYTSGAILSIAFNLPEPAVDGNVMRVLSRLFLIEEDIAKPKTRQLFEYLLYKLIPKKAASDFNQGLMELGALVCKPKKPQCEDCPLQMSCLARHEGTPTQYPVKSKKTKVTRHTYQVLLLKDQNHRLLVHQRPENGLLANLWEFPMISTHKASPLKEELKSAVRKETGLIEFSRVEKYEQVITHTFSHLKWELNVWQMEAVGNVPMFDLPYKWVTEQELLQLPFPVAHQKVWELYKETTKG